MPTIKSKIARRNNNNMKSHLCSKAAIIAVLLSSHVSTAKSFVPSPPMHHHRVTPNNSKAMERPYHNAFLVETINAPVIASRTSRTSEKILSLRAGAGPSLLTIFTSSLNTFFKQNPYAAAFFICGLQASAADFIAQKTSQTNNEKDNAVEIRGGTNSVATVSLSRPSFEMKRNLAFLLYGGIYQGCFQEHLFNKIFPMIFGEGNGLMTVGLKVSFDMLIVSPFLCLPVAYLIKGIIYRLSLMDSMRRYIHDVTENGLLKTYWSIWWPVQAFNFMLVPKQFRISFIACFSFMWLMILSAISGKAERTA